jgi:hypothetical protein
MKKVYIPCAELYTDCEVEVKHKKNNHRRAKGVVDKRALAEEMFLNSDK